MNITTNWNGGADGAGEARRAEAVRRRAAAGEIAAGRPTLAQASNGEETRFSRTQATSFTKGLPHDAHGFVPRDIFERFRAALVAPDPEMAMLEIGASQGGAFRRWESPLAGHYTTLEGPDPDAVAMPPAPKLGRSELCAEMAAVYAMALLRDVPFSALAEEGTVVEGLSWPETHPREGDAVTVGDVVAELRKLSWFDPDRTTTGFFGSTLTEHEKRRRAAHWDGADGLTAATLFRGSTAGSRMGPYLSQFLLLGTRGPGRSDDPRDGVIAYGGQTIDQRIQPAEAHVDYMTTWDDWLEVQNGFDASRREGYEPATRRIATPRDLATYVHFDALYQAYLNACLILLGNRDVGVAMENPIATFRGGNSQGFATWGGPHVLSLVTEVASRALWAVRRQKFQVHRRGRPELIAARLTQVANGAEGPMERSAVDAVRDMLAELGDGAAADPATPGALLHWVAEHNATKGRPSETAKAAGVAIDPARNYLLPMAFSEGSPMHASYGAGHATVAGACVTILKAFFDSDRAFLPAIGGVEALQETDGAGDALRAWAGYAASTIAQELDKLAANISIGRNMAGVHFYSDYYDSLRLGERVAAGILEEQMAGVNERARLSFTGFDGDVVTISTDGGIGAGAVRFGVNGHFGQAVRDNWWTRDLVEYGIGAAGPVEAGA